MISINYLNEFKHKTETFWKNSTIDTNIYGFQFQPGTKWIRGLDEAEVANYEKDIQIVFPEEYKILLHIINGTDLPTVNIYGGKSEKYSVGVYSYPRDLDIVRKRIDDVKVHSTYWEFDIQDDDNLIPFYIHRYIHVRNASIIRVVSIYGDDGIEYGKTFGEYLNKEFQLTTAST